MSEHKGRNCGTTEISEILLKDPQVRERRMAIEASTLARTATMIPERLRPVITIPVVFHIVYNSSAQNIPNGQIASQIKVLNMDYRMLNTDIVKIPEPFKDLAEDSRIEFRLAKRDPEGNQTNGITRTDTSQTSFTLAQDNVKFKNQGGKDAWDTKKYLNIWVCKIAGDTIGYATPPGMASEERDGVVIDYRCLGTEGNLNPQFNKGRTTTHEVGHYLNLYHIWGPEDPADGSCFGSDNVADTPNQLTANSGSPRFPKISCNNAPNGDMFMNYMDYVDDKAMFMFTKGQVRRMDAAINGPRYSLQLSDALTVSSPFDPLAAIDQLRGNDGAKMLFNGVEYVESSKIFSL